MSRIINWAGTSMTLTTNKVPITTRAQFKRLNRDRYNLNIYADGVAFWDIYKSKFTPKYIHVKDISDPFAWPEVIKLVKEAERAGVSLYSDSVGYNPKFSNRIWDLIEEVLEP